MINGMESLHNHNDWRDLLNCPGYSDIKDYKKRELMEFAEDHHSGLKRDGHGNILLINGKAKLYCYYELSLGQWQKTEKEFKEFFIKMDLPTDFIIF